MISVTTFSEAGGHPVSEDAFEVRRHPSDPECWLGFLADGQGGRAGGAEAARIACRVAAQAALAQPPHQLSEPWGWTAILEQADAADALAAAIAHAHLSGTRARIAAALA